MILLSEDRQGSKSRCAITSYKHALFFRYPQCGNRPLYNGILSVKKTCERELDLKNYIGDGVSIIGFFSWMLVPLLPLFECLVKLKLCVHFMILPPIMTLVSVIVLRPVKAALVAHHYKRQF